MYIWGGDRFSTVFEDLLCAVDNLNLISNNSNKKNKWKKIRTNGKEQEK